MIIPRRTIFAFLFLLASSSSLACSCAGSSPLIQIVESGGADYLIRARVEAYDDPGNIYAKSMTVSVLEEFHGSVEAESITVFGDGGMSCSPFVSNYAVGKEWLLPLFYSNEKFYISLCAPPVRVEGEDVIGLASPRYCSQNPESPKSCFMLSPGERQRIDRARMTLDEFRAEMELYSDAVAWTIMSCSGPWSRCNNIRASYDTDSGKLTLPSVDVKESFFFGTEQTMTRKESWDLELVDGTTDTYRKIKSN